MSDRHLKIILSAIMAFYVLLVCLNNTLDYGTNFQFVSHVTAMDDVFSRDHNGWRSIQSPALHHLVYVLIIALEYTIFGLLSAGALSMWKARHAEPERFYQSGRFTTLGYLAGIVLWFGAFIGVAGEWYLMWQSKTWNAQGNAFSLTMVLLLLLSIQTRKEH